MPTLDMRRLTHLGSNRGRQRRIGSHRGLRVIRIPRQRPLRPQTLDQLVELALIHLGHMVVLDERQRVISAQQPGLEGVGTVGEGAAAIEPIRGLTPSSVRR
jgi:hypothetical protein